MIETDAIVVFRRDAKSESQDKQFSEMRLLDFSDYYVEKYAFVIFVNDDQESKILKNRYGNTTE